jgi:hypothetical protein
MRIGIPLGLALVAIGFATPATARQTVLQPTSDWTLDYGEEKCSLLRDFGPLDEGLGLRIDSYGSLTNFQVSVIGDKVPRPELRIPVRPIAYALSPDAELRRDVRGLQGQIGDHRFVQFEVSFRPAEARPDATQGPPNAAQLAEWAIPKAPDLQFERMIDSLDVEIRRGDRIKLDTGPMAPALNALRACVDDLRKSWGLDPVQQRAVVRHAFPQPQAVREVMNDFPRDMVFRGINGFVPLRVMVDATGTATQCVVQLPDAPEPFRAAACANLGERFEPALGEGGQPVSSFYQTAVVYLVRAF